MARFNNDPVQTVLNGIVGTVRWLVLDWISQEVEGWWEGHPKLYAVVFGCFTVQQLLMFQAF